MKKALQGTFKRQKQSDTSYFNGYGQCQAPLKQEIKRNIPLLLITLTLFTLYALYIVIMY